MAKKPKLRGADEVDQLKHQFFDSLKKESDRGCVLVGAAFLDDALELLLQSRMSRVPAVVKDSIEPLFTGIGPLRSFWAKCHLCRALGILQEWEFEDLNRIRNLRNQFAHSYASADFDAPEVVKITSQLQQGIWEKSPVRITDMKQGRLNFTFAVGFLAGTLHHRAGIKGEAVIPSDA